MDNHTLISYGLYLTYVLFGIGALCSVILPLINVISNPKSLIKICVSIGAILAIYFLSYALSGAEVTSVYAKFGVNKSSSKLIGGGLTMVWILLGLSFISSIALEVNRMINK